MEEKTFFSYEDVKVTSSRFISGTDDRGQTTIAFQTGGRGQIFPLPVHSSPPNSRPPRLRTLPVAIVSLAIGLANRSDDSA